MKRIILIFSFFSLLNFGSTAQQKDIILKGVFVPWGTALWHYSLGIESPALGNLTTQTTFNYLAIFDNDGEMPEINKRKTFMQEFRYYITPVKEPTGVKLYAYLYPRICYGEFGRTGSITFPVHDEFSYGGGGGAGFKFGAKRRLYLDFNIGYSYFKTETDYKSPDKIYKGWLPKINLVLCYRIRLGKS